MHANCGYWKGSSGQNLAYLNLNKESAELSLMASETRSSLLTTIDKESSFCLQKKQCGCIAWGPKTRWVDKEGVVEEVL